MLLYKSQHYDLYLLDEILNYHLSMPLRSLNVNIPILKYTDVKLKDIKKLLYNIQYNLFTDNFVKFKFKSIKKHLSLLSVFNRHLWKYQYKCLHDVDTITTEGDDNYFMYFWATKIGDQSHAFDVNPQYMYPLLCNARNKVIFLYNKEHNDFCARAYIRILQTDDEAILLLDDIEYHKDINDSELKETWKKYFIDHAYKRAELLKIKLVIPWIDTLPKEKFNIVLDPSDGIFETSKYINEDENWIQTETEFYEFFYHVYRESKVIQ